jgi:alanine dehydrogenase
MHIGVVKQIQQEERRVPVVPAGVHLLVNRGHTVHVENDAGVAAGFTDEDYRTAGANIVYSRTEAIGRAELLLGVAPIQPEDIALLVPHQTVMSFGHLVTLAAESLNGLCSKGATAVAYELIANDRGERPIVQVMGEIAGPIALTMAARFLESHRGGRGVLLSGLPGVPPAQVAVIGAGTVGLSAVRAALGTGAQVYLFDREPDRIRHANELFGRQVVTYLSYQYNLERVLQFADVVIGAVWVEDGDPPHIITRAMVRSMKKRAVIIDCSIDQGGICETGRPTTLSDPVYVAEGVIHCCVPNLPSAVARTSSFALANALFPYIRHFASGGLDKVLSDQPRFAEGIYIREGEPVHPALRKLAESELPAGV